MTIRDFGDDIVTDSDNTNEGECTGETPDSGYACTKHTLFEKDGPSHIDGNDSGILFPIDVIEDDISGLSYGYCVELAGQNNCPTQEGTPEDIIDPIDNGGDNTDNSSNGGIEPCDSSDPFCQSYANPDGCPEPTIKDAIVPTA